MSARPHRPDREPGDRGESEWRPDGGPKEPASHAVRCDLCGGAMLDRHCKLVCVRCGYQRDCSDP